MSWKSVTVNGKEMYRQGDTIVNYNQMCRLERWDEPNGWDDPMVLDARFAVGIGIGSLLLLLAVRHAELLVNSLPY